jgi:uncharacterized protein involved in exopolysaccharide biosynthesis
VVEPVVPPVLPEPRRRVLILVFSVLGGVVIGGVVAHLRGLVT